MIIIDKTDYTLVIKKEDTDEHKGTFTELQKEYGSRVKVFMGGGIGYLFEILVAKEALFSEDVLILYFENILPEEYQVGVRVGIKVGYKWFGDEDSRTF